MTGFLTRLFDESVNNDTYICIFTLPDARSEYFSTLTSAMIHVNEQSRGGKDVYFGTGLTHVKKGAGKRSESSDICAIGGLWADIDLFSPENPSKPLPKTLDDIQALFDRLPVRPSVVINSGHGIHAWWNFHEPWIFESEEERVKASRIVQGWGKLIQDTAQSFGWKLDSVFDLARVMRLPGTMNRKKDPPVEVKVIQEHPDLCYDPADFADFEVEHSTYESKPQDAETGKLVLKAGAEPPSDKFVELYSSSPVFAKTWDRERTDLEDQSQSSYDQALANIAAMNEWNDQEVASLLISARNKHNQKPEKALRQSYMIKTIANARSCVANRNGEDVDLSTLIETLTVDYADERPVREPGVEDPGPVPDGLLRIPGFCSEVMDYCLETAPYPNKAMAFFGALSLQAFLAARKVRDSSDIRTNLYLLGLANSGTGKDWPRKVNSLILSHIGKSECLGNNFASSEGIQDALFQNPSMLFQTDEIDGMLQSMNKSNEGRYESLFALFLTLYSASDNSFQMRHRADRPNPGVINQPSLVIFGTAIPEHFYKALSDRMLTNGFFARMMILEGGKRAKRQRGSILDIPEHVIQTAKWWDEFKTHPGNMENFNPTPETVLYTTDGMQLMDEAIDGSDAEYAKAEKANDVVAMPIWARFGEQASKLALIYAVSENHEDPVIGVEAVLWATEFVKHQTRRMLFMASSYVADNPFQAECLRLMNRLRKQPDKSLSHSESLRYMRMSADDFHKLVSTLKERGDIAVEVKNQSGVQGRPSRSYRLLN